MLKLRLLVSTLMNALRHAFGIEGRPIYHSSSEEFFPHDTFAEPPKTVIDVGAHTGEFSLFAHRAFPSARIIAFEPIPRAFDELSCRLGGWKGAEAHGVALGEQDGASEMYVHAFSQCSSLLPGTAFLRRAFPYTGFSTKVVVPVRSLDSVLSGQTLHRPALLKIDVQGYEDRVLRGALKTLAMIDAVIIEMTPRPLYKGQVPQTEIVAFLYEHGFSLARTLKQHRSFFSRSVVQEDVLFLRGASPS